MEYRRSEDAYKALERLAQTGLYVMSSEEAVAMLKQTAYDLGLDLSKKVSIKEVRKALGKGTPMAQIMREMREGQ
ncbi:MAG: hypothetical protein H3Z51_10065 [archaeon]|nr:hypothetical protein [archaeon]